MIVPAAYTGIHIKGAKLVIYIYFIKIQFIYYIIYPLKVYAVQ